MTLSFTYCPIDPIFIEYIPQKTQLLTTMTKRLLTTKDRLQQKAANRITSRAVANNTIERKIITFLALCSSFPIAPQKHLTHNKRK